MVNEYISRYYRDKENFRIKAYHSSRNIFDMCDIFCEYSSLEKLNLLNFNTANVKNFELFILETLFFKEYCPF